MKQQTVEKCKHIFYQIVKENDNDLQELSRLVVRMYDMLFKCNCTSTDEKERFEIRKWVRETLLKYCIAMYDGNNKFIIKDDGTVVI